MSDDYERRLIEATRRFIAKWEVMSQAERTAFMQKAGILDEAGDLAPRHRPLPNNEVDPDDFFQSARR